MRLKDRKIIVTGGPTREWIDPVRYISNPSSGKMGAALADRAAYLARETVFVHGPVNPAIVTGKAYRTVSVESTSDLLAAVVGELEDNAVLIMSAAPADYTPVEKSGIKIKKTGDEITLRLKKTPDILKEVARLREGGRFPGAYVVGFAAETNDTENYARSKLVDKNLEMICLNDVSAQGAGFGADTNIMTLFLRNGKRIELSLMSKEEVASRILDVIGSELDS
ncbi:MAG TPA: phosphopantothenoylcysteine decarboxylase [Spirochaetota bacterium]|nr:phosphopantothenoylcysteine decarboxylase [Spirochaetota bacterium]HPI91074.1 phosphopantothenoylcysteine decarboxylase [Spirochaetota bacterium]HPR47733.1 phosphopantothenoylcysteine decarboxylase [Spirochaetota bacterium]